MLWWSGAQHAINKQKQRFNSSYRTREGFQQDVLPKLNHEEWVDISQAMKGGRKLWAEKTTGALTRRWRTMAMCREPQIIHSFWSRSCVGVHEGKYGPVIRSKWPFTPRWEFGVYPDVMEKHRTILTEGVLWSDLHFRKKSAWCSEQEVWKGAMLEVKGTGVTEIMTMGGWESTLYRYLKAGVVRIW